jgi:hypothetical protein
VPRERKPPKKNMGKADEGRKVKEHTYTRYKAR